MQKQHRSLAVLGALALVTVGVAINPPQASIAILTHDVGDTSPGRFETAIGVGGAVLQLLITWTVHRAL